MVMGLAATMVPKEMNYFVPGAQGNKGTCTAPGFIITAGVTVVAAYNCSTIEIPTEKLIYGLIQMRDNLKR